jgi:hypothetical protein
MSVSVSAYGLGRRLRITYWLILAILMQGTLISCDSTETKQEAVLPPTKPQNVPKLPEPLRLRVVVPYGGNMPGFMNFAAGPGAIPTEFQHRIGALLTIVGKGPTTLAARTFVTTDATGNLVTSTYEQLAALVDGTKPRSYIHGLMIPPLLNDAVAACDKDTSVVTILVTDMVHNAGDPKTLSSLSGDVSAALKGKRGAATFSLYAEPSSFVGDYYPAIERKPHKVHNASIPYYIWFIGTPKQISRVTQAYLPNPPERQAHVGLTYPGLAVGALLDSLPPASPLEPGSQNSGGSVWFESGKVVASNVANGIEFNIGLDLHQLPSAWQNPAFLNANLRAWLPGGTVVLLPKSVRWLTPAEHAASPALKLYTHTARVRLTKLASNASTLTLSLPAPALPAWPGLWTTATDQPPGLSTYSLKQMLEGARQAHGEGALPDVFSVSIPPINQED